MVTSCCSSSAIGCNLSIVDYCFLYIFSMCSNQMCQFQRVASEGLFGSFPNSFSARTSRKVASLLQNRIPLASVWIQIFMDIEFELDSIPNQFWWSGVLGPWWWVSLINAKQYRGTWLSIEEQGCKYSECHLVYNIGLEFQFQLGVINHIPTTIFIASQYQF